MLIGNITERAIVFVHSTHPLDISYFINCYCFRIYDIQGAKQLHCYKGSISEEGNLIKVHNANVTRKLCLICI